MAEQGKEPSLHNEELEAAVKDFKADQTKEKMLKIMTCLEKATVMQPGAGQNGKVPVRMTNQTKPAPIVLKNDKGEQFFAVFTGKGQIPENQRFPAMMYLPFKECAKMAAKKESGLAGIVLNPFTDNLVLHMAGLEALNEKHSQLSVEDRIKQRLWKKSAAEKKILRWNVMRKHTGTCRGRRRRFRTDGTTLALSQ